MIGVSYAGKPFAAIGVSCNFPDGMFSGPSVYAVAIEQIDAPPINVGTRQSLRLITIAFLPDGSTTIESARIALLAALAPGRTQPQTFVAQLNDGTNLECLMTVGQWRVGQDEEVNITYVDFYAADDRWFKRVDTIYSQIKFSGPIAIPLLNHGGASVAPVIKLGSDTQRTTESATVGWKWRRTKTISNGGDRNWNRVRLTIDLGDTSAWVSGGKALASGDDVRVRFEGRELYRTLTNWNSKRTFVHFVGTIPAGGSATYEVLYGNPDATTPRDLSTRTSHYDTYVADDLEGDFGTATAGTTTTLTDGGKSWGTDEWAGGWVAIVAGTESTHWRRITSNTGTVLTLNRILASAIDNTSQYVLFKSGIFLDGGRVTGGITSTTIQDNLHTDKWAPDSLKGATWVNLSGTSTPTTMTVASNTTDTLTFTTAFSVNPGVNAQYTIQRWGILNYNVDKSVTGRAHRGLWRSSHYSSNGGEIAFGDRTPGGWQPWLMVDNQDQFAQLRVTDETAGASVANWPYLSARRRVRSDLTMPEKGIADGVCLYEPRGLVALDWNYRFENDNGIGAVSVMIQQPDGDNWQEIVNDDTTHASLTAVTSGGAAGGYSITSSGNDPVRLYCGVIPANGVDSEIASTESKNRNAEVRNHTRMMAFISLDDCGGLSSSMWSIGSEAAIYDLNVTGRLGGGAIGSEVQPYYSFAVGGDGHYLHLASGQKLWINPNPSASAPLFGIYDSSDLLVSTIAYPAVIKRHVLNLSGVDTALTDWRLSVPPATNLISTGEDNITGWTITPGAGVTANLLNNTTASAIFDGGATSLEVQVTAAPAGAWTIELHRSALITVIPGALYEFGFLRRRSFLTSAVSASMDVYWDYYNPGLTNSAVDTSSSAGGTIPVSETWYPAGTGRKIHAGSAATPATTVADVYIEIASSGATTGSLFFDAIALGVPNLYLDEAEIGIATVDISWREAVIA